LRFVHNIRDIGYRLKLSVRNKERRRGCKYRARQQGKSNGKLGRMPRSDPIRRGCDQSESIPLMDSVSVHNAHYYGRESINAQRYLLQNRALNHTAVVIDFCCYP